MRSLVALLALVAVVCAAQPGAAARRARVAVTSTAPLTVRGTLFGAGERVSVVAQANGIHRRKVTATARGTFLVRFRGVAVEHCQGYLVRATGNRGSYGYLRVIPECAPLEPGAGP